MEKQFETNKNFTVIDGHWGDAQLENIAKLLDNVTSTFFEPFDKDLLPQKPVTIKHIRHLTTYEPRPEFRLGNDGDEIFLDTQNKAWAQYSYQFSHELCHHVVAIGFKTEIRFKWLEEVFCELASLICLEKMAVSWVANPPYPNWSSFAPALKEYQQQIISQDEQITHEPFPAWFTKTLNELYVNQYQRTENRIIALQLMDLFKPEPTCWQTIQYLKNIEATEDMSFTAYLNAWEIALPAQLSANFAKIKSIFTK